VEASRLCQVHLLLTQCGNIVAFCHESGSQIIIWDVGILYYSYHK
jgi:hypothetical protein